MCRGTVILKKIHFALHHPLTLEQQLGYCFDIFVLWQVCVTTRTLMSYMTWFWKIVELGLTETFKVSYERITHCGSLNAWMRSKNGRWWMICNNFEEALSNFLNWIIPVDPSLWSWDKRAIEKVEPPSHYYLFPKLKKHLKRKRHSSNEEVIDTIEQWFA